MEKEDVTVLAQLLTSIQDALDELEKAQKKKDLEKIADAKNEILRFQKEVRKLL